MNGSAGTGGTWRLAALLAVGLVAQPLSLPQAQEAGALPPPVAVEDGIAKVAPEDLIPLPGGRSRVRVDVPEEDAAPVLGAKMTGLAAEKLRRLYAEGAAAGNWGDLYENRDRRHSDLDPALFPQMTRIDYADALAKGRGYGVALDTIYDAPLLGNSSTALTSGAFWRSQARYALTQTGGAARLFENYAANQIHVYPEHRDHDPERGDLLPANTPYVLISQGSSGSDRAHMQAVAMILAAFRPETKARLTEAGLIAPTVQMVYRRGREGAGARAAYLSGAAHPTVFGPGEINLPAMVGLANAIAPEEIPPMVRLQVLDETRGREGVDYFGEGTDERLFETPSAIARVWRSKAGRREMTVSAADTVDPNGRELDFTWVLLRGDPARTRIEELTPDGRYARIVVDWQDPRPAPGRPDIMTPRVEIGVFADNGAQLSAPAFVSILLPRHERRLYEAGPEGGLRIVSLDRRVAEGAYADPLIFPRMDWHDVYEYGPDGAFEGWVRHGPSGETRFDAEGYRIGPGAAAREKVRYEAVTTPSGPVRLEMEATGE